MKSASEWLQFWCFECKTVENQINQVQLDAWRQGMTDAVKFIRSNPRYTGQFWIPDGLESLRDSTKSV